MLPEFRKNCSPKMFAPNVIISVSIISEPCFEIIKLS